MSTVASAAVSDADLAWVRYLAKRDPRSVVRIAAWQSLLSEDPDAAVAEFLASGFDYSVGLAAQRRQRNADFAARVLAVFTAEFSPEVHAAAGQAVRSPSDADRAAFAAGGFDAARRRDSAARAETGERAAALRESDRAFVRELAGQASGEQVRVAAGYAVRTGAGDAELVDFFSDGWAFASRLDLETFRERGADAETRWRAQAAELLTQALAAEQAAKDAAAENAEQARAAAARAWRTLGEQTTPGRSYWGEAAGAAERSAADWAAVASAAAAASGPNWAAIPDLAHRTAQEWDAERAVAADNARYWAELAERAAAGESRTGT